MLHFVFIWPGKFHFFLRTWISYVCGNDEEVNFLISSNFWHIEILIAG